MQIAMEEAAVKNPLVVAKDGSEAIAYLNGDDQFTDRGKFPLPILVLLDLRLPRVPGLEVLKWIREQPDLTKLPVIVHSSSDQDSDVDAAYKSGADAYLVKTSQPSERLKMVRCLKTYWLEQKAPPENCQQWFSLSALRRVADRH
jgi:CheY-like chemotaxis protein